MSKTYPLLFSLLLALPACGAAESEDGSAGESGQALASGTHWVTHRVHLNQATHVDLANLGAHTHSNWVTWQLPYNLTYMTNHPDQFNRIFFTPHSDTNTDVGAAREPNTKICIPLPDSGHGPIVAWGRDTAAGAGGTSRFDSHPSAQLPAFDDYTFAVNVPTRVANYVECYPDTPPSDQLKLFSNYSLDMQWDHFE